MVTQDVGKVDLQLFESIQNYVFMHVLVYSFL